MPPPPSRGDLEDIFWSAALALLSGRAAVIHGDMGRESRYPQVRLDMRLVMADRDPVPDDPRQLRLAVATMLAERIGMRLTPTAPPTTGTVSVSAPIAPDQPTQPPRRDEDDSRTRFSLLELD